MPLSSIAAANSLEHSLSRTCILGASPRAFNLLTSTLYARTISPEFLFFIGSTMIALPSSSTSTMMY